MSSRDTQRKRKGEKERESIVGAYIKSSKVTCPSPTCPAWRWAGEERGRDGTQREQRGGGEEKEQRGKGNGRTAGGKGCAREENEMMVRGKEHRRDAALPTPPHRYPFVEIDSDDSRDAMRTAKGVRRTDGQMDRQVSRKGNRGSMEELCVMCVD